MSDWLDKIESYVAGELSSDERLAFDHELKESKELRHALDRYRIISDALEVEVQHNLREHLHGLSQHQTEGKTIAQKFIGLRFVAVAASLALLVFAGYWIANRPSAIDQLALNEMYQSVELSTTRGEDIPQELAEGFELTKSNKVDEALVFFLAATEKEAENYTAHFMLGDLYKKQGELKKAKNEMLIVLDGESLIWYEKAQLNYLLLSAEIGWDSRSNSVLAEILGDPNHPYIKQAKQLKLQQNTK